MVTLQNSLKVISMIPKEMLSKMLISIIQTALNVFRFSQNLNKYIFKNLFGYMVGTRVEHQICN